MDDIFPLLLFLIFIIGPIIEGLRKKNQPPPPPPRQQQRRVPPAPSRTEEVARGPRVEEDAATMVPDELWEILTGQKRPQAQLPQPQPREEKRPSWDVVYDPELEEEYDEEAELENVEAEDTHAETRRTRVEAQSLETIGRHPEPIIISLEENIPSHTARHAEFHRKIAQPVPAIRVPAPRTPLLDLHNKTELQRAFMLMEVLGPPKGLE